MSAQTKPLVYIGLLHHPVYNKRMEVIATSITNLDIHDIARSSCTYDVTRYFVIHPLETQRKLMEDVLDYWQNGYGAQYNPDRKYAFEKVALVASLDDTIEEIRRETGILPKVVMTDARVYPNTIGYGQMREMLADGTPYLLVFGTGWGVEKETMLRSDYILEPIYGAGEYNHLSVRAAAAIILDRLLGEAWWNSEQ